MTGVLYDLYNCCWRGASATGSRGGDSERERKGIGSSHGNGNGINESHMQRLSDDFAALMTCQPAGVEASYNDYPESDTLCCELYYPGIDGINSLRYSHF